MMYKHEKPQSRPLDPDDPHEAALSRKLQSVSMGIHMLFAASGLNRGEGMTAIAVFLGDNIMVDEVDVMIEEIKKAIKFNHAQDPDIAKRDAALKLLHAQCEAAEAGEKH